MGTSLLERCHLSIPSLVYRILTTPPEIIYLWKITHIIETGQEENGPIETTLRSSNDTPFNHESWWTRWASA